MSANSEDAENCIKTEMLTMYPEEYARTYGGGELFFDELMHFEAYARIFLTGLKSKTSRCDAIESASTQEQEAALYRAISLAREIADFWDKMPA